MTSSGESDEGLVEALALPVGLPMAPIAAVPGNAVNELVMADILRCLVSVASSSSEREAKGVVGGLVRSILPIGENGGTKLVAHVSDIDPLLRGDLELFRIGRRPPDCSYIPVVGSELIGSGKRKGCLQIRFLGFPIDHIGEFDALACVPGGKPNDLDEMGDCGFTGIAGHGCFFVAVALKNLLKKISARLRQARSGRRDVPRRDKSSWWLAQGFWPMMNRRLCSSFCRNEESCCC
jgi:hypothetical protein